MMARMAQLMSMLVLCAATGCATHRADSFAFLGIPETEASDQGPVGMINGKPCQIKNMSPVYEATYQEYQTAKQKGQVFAEDTHAGYMYYAVKVQRDVRFNNSAAWVDIIERFKAKIP